jgi:alkylation response protein AidB-like acyl-CoA dehydrogenase
MDFELTEEQKDIQKAAREFAEVEFEKNYVLELDRNHQFPWEIWRTGSRLLSLLPASPNSL